MDGSDLSFDWQWARPAWEWRLASRLFWSGAESLCDRLKILATIIHPCCVNTDYLYGEELDADQRCIYYGRGIKNAYQANKPISTIIAIVRLRPR